MLQTWLFGYPKGNCSEYHPPWCHRFTRNGPGGKRGCRYSDNDCHFWHPTLCQNGLKMKSCLNTDCKLVHIRGTNRSHQTQDQVKGSSKPGTPKPAPNVKANKKQISFQSTQATSGRNYADAVKRNPVASTARTRSDSVSSSQSNKPPGKHRPNPQNNNEDFQKHLESLKADLKADLQSMMTEMIKTSFQTIFQPPKQHLIPQQPQMVFQAPQTAMSFMPSI